MIRLGYLLVCTQENKKFHEKNSTNTLFLSFRVGKTMYCCKTSILKKVITAASDLSHKTFLLKYMASEMVLKDFQSIKESILSSLSPTN